MRGMYLCSFISECCESREIRREIIFKSKKWKRLRLEVIVLLIMGREVIEGFRVEVDRV